MSHLNSGRLNIGLIKDAARRDLLEILTKRSGSKAIVWDSKLVGPYGLIAEYSTLEKHGVTQMFQLRSGRLPSTSASHVIFLVRPKPHLMSLIAENIKAEASLKKKMEFHVVFVPGRSLICERKLEELDVFAKISSIDEHQVFFFPFDCDVISMELEDSFKQINVENDLTSLLYAAKGLMKLQALYGVIPSIYGQGRAAKQVVDLILKMRRELSGSGGSGEWREINQMQPQIDGILLLDRAADLITPFMTQRTYEGLLDEIYGINNNTIKLPPEKFSQQEAGMAGSKSPPGSGGAIEPATEVKKFVLNSSEDLFNKLRDKHFHAVGPTLAHTARSLTTQFEERHQAKTVSEMKMFVERLPVLQAARKSQSNHTSMAELVKQVTDTESYIETVHFERDLLDGLEVDKQPTFIDECIGKEEPLHKVLRLLCLHSYTSGGALKPKILDYYRREILHTYGFENILTLRNLEKSGLLKAQGAGHKNNYNTIRKTLRLTLDPGSGAADELNPQDISYIYSGYAPLSVRLAQFLVHPGWRAIQDVLKLLPQPTIEETQQIPAFLRKRRPSGSSIASLGGGGGGIQLGGEDQRVILVFFLGGCTFSEISALRFLSQQDDFNVDFVVATTKLMNGKTFLESLDQPLKTTAKDPFN